MVSPLCIRNEYHILCGALYTMAFSLIISIVVVTRFTHKTFIVLLSFFVCVIGVKKFFMHDDQIYVKKKRKKFTPNNKLVGAHSATSRSWTGLMVFRAYPGD